jgi:ubiquinone/menaquinone biosynthesis C-methylase UbiE
MNEWKLKRTVMRNYDLTAHLYDMRYAEEQAAKIRAALEKVELGGGSYVLDFGCGTGLLFEYIAEKVWMIVGLDLSRKALNEAKKRSKMFGNVHLVLADADYAPLRSGVFTHVFAITILQNMPNPWKTLNEAKRVAVKNAALVVTGLKKKFSLEEFKGILCENGLSIADIRDGDNLKCYVAICFNQHS